MANLTLRYLDELSYVLNSRKHLASQAKASSVGDLLNADEDRYGPWITPEECAVYAREQRPPLVIPRITQYRPQRREHRERPYMEENIPEQGSLKSQRQYERVPNWSPSSERSRADLERTFNKANSDSPPFVRLNKRLEAALPAAQSLYDVTGPERLSYLPKDKFNSVWLPVVVTYQSPVIFEGPVKRTKFFEGGKKCKKNWSECYMVLTPTALVFYKDQKTYYATKMPKPPGTPPSPTSPHPELVLPLRNSRVLQCISMHTRRHTKSLVLSVDYDQYLIQDESEEGARHWLQTIERVIRSLWSTMPPDSLTPQYQSSNTDLESLGRTPPTSRHVNRANKKAGGSSNEDLSDGTEASIQKSDITSKLRKFFAKRPSVDVLVKKGIYKDEPVFGRNLEEVCPSTSPRVPEFVVACVKEIEKSEENMCTDGLYRASGNLSQVQKIRLEVDQNNRGAIENSNDIHVLTGSLKLFFRELKEPLIPYSMFERVLAACSIKPKEAKIKEFRDIIQSLPQCNRDTLKYLLEHLLKVTQHSERNRMHTANLAIVFGPTLLWASPEPTPRNVAVDCIQQNNVVEILLNEFKEIFDESKAKKKA
ncbi:hypothetical protein K1T71_011465 [Dendrolimus kikuchii]|uniref:Uncharacterized protein n=1 Tax=Dendrolimus kikuchii TaxID=765133 RepID=A0ACC1CPF7_9NEOP|nr:hypothetical protein K1T71_011465 [Dendrolimus kikuchii]